MDNFNPHMMGKISAFGQSGSGEAVEDEHNEFFEVVEYNAAKGMVEIGFDGPKNLRIYVTLPLMELVGIAAAFGREEPK